MSDYADIVLDEDRAWHAQMDIERARERGRDEWDDEAWCAHGGHVHPTPGCPFCPEADTE